MLSCSADRAEPLIGHNDNLRVAGRSSEGTHTLGLEVSRGRWNAGGAAGPGASALAFGEADSSASIPGPLIRVDAGTRIRLDLSNRSVDSVTVLGFAAPSGGEIERVLGFEKVPDMTNPELMDGHDHSVHGMRGLVLGINVTGDGSGLPQSDRAPRLLRLEVVRREPTAHQ